MKTAPTSEYEPNLRAVRYLHHTLAPRVAPDTVIDVFGRYPRGVRGLADRVRLRGPVADLRAALATVEVGIRATGLRRRHETEGAGLPHGWADQAPYWWHEWRGRSHPRQEGHDVADDTGGQRQATSVVGALAEAIDCARLAAESALDTVFADRAIVGYGGRSMVFLAPKAVLKIYTHRPGERLHREITGLRLVATLAGLRIPAVLGHDDLAGSLAWMSATRLDGRLPPGGHQTGR